MIYFNKNRFQLKFMRILIKFKINMIKSIADGHTRNNEKGQARETTRDSNSIFAIFAKIEEPKWPTMLHVFLLLLIFRLMLLMLLMLWRLHV